MSRPVAVALLALLLTVAQASAMSRREPSDRPWLVPPGEAGKRLHVLQPARRGRSQLPVTRCVQCGHAYFAAWSRGHSSGLCIACRLGKDGGLRPARPIAPAPLPSSPGDGWVTLHEAAPLLGLKVTTLRTLPWLVRLGAIKVGQGWWVARTVLDALKEQRD